MSTRENRLEDFALLYASCPCCEGTETCDEECTFASDCPNEHTRMLMARDALQPEERSA